MKCCIISTLYPPNIVGGAEKVTAKLAAGLVRAGHSVVVITLHLHHEMVIKEVDGVKVYYLPLDNIYWPFNAGAKPPAIKRLMWHLIDMWNTKAAARVAKILDEEQPDVLNSNNLAGFSVAVWAQAKKRGIKIIHTLHDYALLCPASTLYKNGAMCQVRCTKCVGMSFTKYIASRWVDQLVGVSQFVADKHKQFGYFSNAALRVIRNICDLPIANSKKSPEVKSQFTFGFIGRIEEEKGIEVLLRAASHLPAQGWRLLIAGRGREDYVSRLKDLYPQTNIEWLGFTKPDDFYPMIDVLIVPSLWPEPLPGVIAEAGALDIPVIISKMGGMPEYLDMGLSGKAIPAGDAACLTQEMKDAMAGQGVMARSGAATANWRSELSEHTVVEHYVGCYNDAIRRGSA